MYKKTILHNFGNSSISRQFLSCFVLTLLVVQWGLIRHMESHLYGEDTDYCQMCTIGNHMANAISFSPPSIPVVPPQIDPQITRALKSGYSPLVVFLARAPPLSIV